MESRLEGVPILFFSVISQSLDSVSRETFQMLQLCFIQKRRGTFRAKYAGRLLVLYIALATQSSRDASCRQPGKEGMQQFWASGVKSA